MCINVIHTVPHTLLHLETIWKYLKHAKHVFKKLKQWKQELRDSKWLTVFPVESYTSSKKVNSAHHLERITVGYSWAYPSLSGQETAYFSWVDPVPAREVANHMKLVWSSLFTHSNLHRWERMGCWDLYSRALFSPPPLGNAGCEFISFINSTPRFVQLLNHTCKTNILKQFYK